MGKAHITFLKYGKFSLILLGIIQKVLEHVIVTRHVVLVQGDAQGGGQNRRLQLQELCPETNQGAVSGGLDRGRRDGHGEAEPRADQAAGHRRKPLRLRRDARPRGPKDLVVLLVILLKLFIHTVKSMYAARSMA